MGNGWAAQEQGGEGGLECSREPPAGTCVTGHQPQKEWETRVRTTVFSWCWQDKQVLLPGACLLLISDLRRKETWGLEWTVRVRSSACTRGTPCEPGTRLSRLEGTRLPGEDVTWP